MTGNRSLISEVFISSDEPRLRAGWRLLLQFLLMLLFMLMTSLPVVVYFIFTREIKPTSDLVNPGKNIMIALEIAEFLMITGSVFLARRLFDRRSLASLGLAFDWAATRDIGAGIVVSFLIMTFVFCIEFLLGWVNFEGFIWQAQPTSKIMVSLLAYAFIFVLTGWNEELLSRGYHLQNLSDGIGRFWGVIISSAVFGVAHITNPNATWIATLGIFFGGLFFAYAYIQTNQLWLPIGLHIGWNFSQGVLFGFPVSGLGVESLLRIQFYGPELWSGGAFGPEGGLVLYPGLLIGFGLIYFYINRLRRNHE